VHTSITKEVNKGVIIQFYDLFSACGLGVDLLLRFPDLGFLHELGKLLGLDVAEMKACLLHTQGFSSSVCRDSGVEIARGFTGSSQVELMCWFFSQFSKSGRCFCAVSHPDL